MIKEMKIMFFFFMLCHPDKIDFYEFRAMCKGIYAYIIIYYLKGEEGGKKTNLGIASSSGDHCIQHYS